MSHGFMMPQRVVYGPDALTDAAALVGSRGTRALLVTDATMVSLGNARLVEELLASAGIEVTVFAEVNAEPDDRVVRAGVERYRAGACDMIVGLGGGSPIDTMKAIALMIATERDIDTFLGEEYTGEVCPLIAIPTTAGTGSEATQFTIITDTERDVKMLLKGAALLPDVAIVDPRFTITAPAGVTAATGVDALCHAIEAYTSRRAQPLSDVFALSAAQRIFANLLTCYREPGNVAARAQLSLAATEAGVAFNNASVTIIHGMSRPIGALFHVPHGLSNAMLMEACLRFALPGAPERFAAVARACGLSDAADDETAANDLMTALHELLAALNIATPRSFGIDEEAYRAAIPKMARDAEASGSPGNTIRPVSIEEMEELYRAVYDRA